MAISFEEIAAILGIEKEKVLREGVKAFLEKRLRELRAEIVLICLRYGVSSLKELDEKINKGELSETETFEDFTMLDFLESEEGKIKRLMTEL